MSFPISISIPTTKKDLWLNLDSEKSVVSWYKTIKQRRKKMNDNDMKKLKEKFYKGKKTGNIFKLMCTEIRDNKGWRQVFYEIEEETDIYLDKDDDLFSFLRD